MRKQNLSVLQGFRGSREAKKGDGLVYGMHKPYCAGSSTQLSRIRILRSTFNVRCLGPLGGFEKLWTARPWPVEHIGGRGQQRVRAHLELCQSTQGQGQLSANFHGPKLAAVLLGRGLASSLEVSPLPESSKDPSLQAEFSDLDSDLTCAEHLIVIPAVIKGSAVM